MKNIKFRAYIKAKKEIVEVTGIDFEKKTIIEYNDGDGIGQSTDFELMQFIGFTDRKGVDVYTGDIIQNANGIIGEVFFDENDLQYKIKENSGDIETFAWYNRNTYHFLEVIGNIFENNTSDR